MERDHLRYPSVDGKILLRWIFRKWDVGFELNRADSGWDRWRGLVNTIMNLWVS